MIIVPPTFVRINYSLHLGYSIRLQRILRRQQRQKMRRTRLSQKRYSSRHNDSFQRFKVRNNDHRSPEAEKFPPKRSNNHHKQLKPHSTFNHKEKQRAAHSKLYLHHLPLSNYRKNTYLNKRMIHPVRSQSYNQQSYRNLLSLHQFR